MRCRQRRDDPEIAVAIANGAIAPPTCQDVSRFFGKLAATSLQLENQRKLCDTLRKRERTHSLSHGGETD